MKVRDLNYRHPAYDDAALQQIDALYRGGRPWHDMVSTWLPQAPAEGAKLWQERKARATYTNYVATILDLIVSQLFGAAPMLDVSGDNGADADAGLQEEAERLSLAADGEATPLATLAREGMTEALRFQRAWALVELPATSQAEFASLADQQAAGATRAYIRTFPTRSVINWRMRGGRVVWMVAREDVQEQADPLTPPERVTRFTVVDEAHIRVFERRRAIDNREPLSDDDEVQEVSRVEHGRKSPDGRPLCPVVVLELPAGLYAGGKLHDPAVGLTRSENDLDWALYRGANELLVIRDAHMEPDVPVLGHGYYLRITDPNGEAYYTGPSGASMALLAERVRERRSELYRIVQQMALAADPSAGSLSASAASKAQDWTASDRMLSSYADEIRGWLQELCRQVLSVRLAGVLNPAQVRIGGLDGWQRETTESFLAQAAAAIEAKAMSPTFTALLAKEQARRVLSDAARTEDFDVIDREVDEAAAGLAMPTGMGAETVRPDGADDGQPGSDRASDGAGPGAAAGPGGGRGASGAGGRDGRGSRRRRDARGRR